MVVPFMTIYCTQQLHFSLAQAGLVMALFGAGSMIGAFSGGRITDKFGFYPLQIAALLSGGILFITVGYLRSLATLCSGVFVLAICNESFRPANSTAIAHYSSIDNRTRSYSLNRLAINLGFSVGGALGGFLASKNYQLLFWVDGITNILASALMFFLLPVVKHHLQNKKEEPIVGGSPYHDSIYLFFILLVVLYAVCFLQMFGMQPVFYKTKWHITEQQVGFLMAMNGLLIASFEMILVHSFEGRKGKLFFIRLGLVFISTGFLLINVLPHFFVSACLIILLITAGEVLSLPFMNSYWLSRTRANNRGRYAALYTMAWSTANIIAPTMGSQAAQHIGFNFLWGLVGAIALIVSGGFWVLQKKVTE